MSKEPFPKLDRVARIKDYFHCAACFESGDEDREKESGLLAVGWTEEGLQVFCESCARSVIDLDFKGQKVTYL